MDFLRRLKVRLNAKRAGWRRRRIEWVLKQMIRLAALPGKLKLRKSRPLHVLIDNSVLRHGLTHTNAWISTGTKLRGGVVPIDTGFSARIPRRYPPHQAKIYEEEVPYFAALTHLGKSGHITYFTSEQLQFERIRQPSYNRFRYGLNVWMSVPIKSLPFRLGGTDCSIADRQWASAEAQSRRVLKWAGEDFQRLAAMVPMKHILDFYHLWLAKKGGCSIFLTTDSRFQRFCANLPSDTRNELSGVSVKRPSELATELGLHPIPYKLLTPLGASFPYRIPEEV